MNYEASRKRCSDATLPSRHSQRSNLSDHLGAMVSADVPDLDDAGLERVYRTEAELDAFVHVDDVIDAAQAAIETDNIRHHRLILCGPGHFDTKPARSILGWKPHRDWAA